jgi:hypothetical protein
MGVSKAIIRAGSQGIPSIEKIVFLNPLKKLLLLIV